MSRLKAIVKDSAIYGLSGIITRMITIFLVPIYSRIFSTEDYGTLSVINNTFFVVNMLVSFNLDSAAARWFYDKDSIENKKSVFSSWFWYQMGSAVLAAGLMFISLPLFSDVLLDMPVRESFMIWLLPCITLVTNILPVVIWNWFRFNDRPLATFTFTICQSLTTILLTMWFVIGLDLGIAGVLGALFLSNLLFSAGAFIVMKDWLKPALFSRDLLKSMWKFSLPLLPASIAYWLLNSSNGYFILFFRDKGEVGLFSVGASLAAGVNLFTGAFQQAWGPFAYSISDQETAPDTYAKVFDLYGLISGFVILAVFLFSPEVLQLLTSPAYYGAAWVASILSVSFIMLGYSSIVSIGPILMKNNRFYAQGVLIGSVVTVLLQFLLVPFWSKEGSAIGTVIGQMIVPVYVLYFGQRVYRVPYQTKRAILFIAVPVAIGVFFRLTIFEASSNAGQFLVKLLVLSVYGAVWVYAYRSRIVSFLSTLKKSRQ